jgi:hypothetical protein
VLNREVTSSSDTSVIGSNKEKSIQSHFKLLIVWYQEQTIRPITIIAFSNKAGGNRFESLCRGLI